MKNKKKVSPRIRELVEEAIVDAHDREEQETGFLCMLQDNMATPFKALVIGEAVEVIGFDLSAGDRGIAAVCKRKSKKYSVNVTSLEWAGNPPEGAECIEAYKVWVHGNW